MQDVDGHEDVVRPKRCFVDHLRTRDDRLTGRLDPLVGVPVGDVDELSAGDVLPRQIAHARALVEDGLQLRAGLELRRVPVVNLPPERAVALEAGSEPGLRQAHGSHDEPLEIARTSASSIEMEASLAIASASSATSPSTAKRSRR